jgi:pyruvate formate lyase activating enzyme
MIMPENDTAATTSLIAASPFELRVDLGRDVPESQVRAALTSGEIGFLHSFTTGSGVDGPGVRVVAWTAGCQWRCLYCHNPDAWVMSNGMPVTIARAVEELSKYRSGLHIMSGGITMSGGEPLLQDRFVIKLLTAAQRMGIHTAIETNGNLGDRLSDEELDRVDLVLLGLKAWDSERHVRLTGMDPAPTRRLAQRIAARKRPIWVRFVLVPGLTDDYEDIARIAEFSAGLGIVERVDVLPFHQLGKFKWTSLNIRYKLADVEPPTPDAVERACSQFRSAGLKTI